MSSGWVHRRAYVECDGKSCHEVIEGDSIRELWSDAKADGWTGKKVDDEWEHYCPSCSDPFGGVLRVKSAK